MTQLFRNRNIANTCWNISDTFLYPALFFGSTSFFIHKLGAVQFGIWMLINTIVVSMQLFNFGVGSSVFRNIAFHNAQHNEKGKMAVLSNAISVTGLLFVTSLLLASIGAYLVFSHDLLHVEPAFRGLCTKGILLGGFLVGFKFFEQVFTAYFKAMERYNKAMAISTGNRLTALLLNIFMLVFFPFSILHLLIVIISVNVLFFIISFWLLYQDFPRFRFTFSLKLPKQDASFALFTWLQSFVIILTFQADRYLVVDHFGLAVLSYYAITATIFSHIYMLFNAVFAWVATKLTRLHAQQADTMALFMAARNIIAIGSLLLLFVMFLLYPLVFQMVLGKETSVQIQEYTRYFIVFELFFALNIVPNYYFNAIGQERKYFYFILFFAVMALLSMLGALMIFNEPIAVLYGLIVSCAISIVVQNIMLHKITNGRLTLLKALSVLLPPLLISFYMLSEQNVVHWAALVISIPASYIIYLKGNLNQFKLLLRS